MEGDRLTSGSDAFDRLRNALTSDRALRAEVEQSLLALVEKVNVSDRGSRWVAGGTAEWILAAAAYAAGAIALPAGHNADGFDLEEVLSAARSVFGVKSSFSKSADYRLTNGLGGAGKGFAEPTVFLHPRLDGIVYVDPEQHPEILEHVKTRSDATVISLSAVRIHAEQHPECVIPLQVPLNLGRGTIDPTTLFAKELLTSGHYPLLQRVFEAASGATRSIADEIRELRKLRDEGALTAAQFTQAVDLVVGSSPAL